MKPLFDPTVHVRHRVKAGMQNANEIPAPPEGLELRRVWTIMNDGDHLVERGLVHNDTGFIEEKRHDWQLDDRGRLLFYSRLVPTDETVEVVLDYEPMPDRELRFKEHGLNVAGRPLKPARKPAR